MSTVKNLEKLNEEQLFNLYQKTRDQVVRDYIVDKYLYIVNIIAKKFTNRGVEYEDIYQVASIGLLQAIERYDLAKGIKFTSFATPTIIGEIKRYFRDKGNIIRIPRRIYEIYQKVSQAKQLLTQSLERAPKVEEISEYLGIPEETILEVLESSNITTIQSLEQSIYTDDDASLKEVVGVEDYTFTLIENKDFIERGLQSFNEAEREFIKQRYYNKKTQKQIAERLGVSQMYISRLERKVLDKFRRLYYKSVN